MVKGDGATSQGGFLLIVPDTLGLSLPNPH